MSFLPLQKSVIPALDCPPQRAVEIVRGTQGIEGVCAFKLGAWAGTNIPGVEAYVNAIRPYLDGRLVIYDHQKGGTDIPDMAKHLAALRTVGVDGLIIFPLTGPETQERWTSASMEADLTILTGGHMTHRKYLRSEGGYVADDAPEMMYRLAVRLGVRDFVVPGNKPELVGKYRDIILNELAEQDHHDDEFALYAPGLVAQGGTISEAGKAAGKWWHGIVGRALLNADDVEAAAKELVSQLAA